MTKREDIRDTIYPRYYSIFDSGKDIIDAITKVEDKMEMDHKDLQSIKRKTKEEKRSLVVMYNRMMQLRDIRRKLEQSQK